jgi:hypothetical protein
MVRAARQFHVHARFAPERPAVDVATYRRLIAEIVGRDPRRQTPAADPVVVPGYADLRAFSVDHEELLKEALAGPWKSYVQRGNWRMIFPFGEGHQRRLVARLLASLGRGQAPIVHVLRYPSLTLNHMLLVFAAEDAPGEIRFHAYDPNEAAAAIVLRWDRGARTFLYPRTPYFGGGPVKVYEIYDGLLF